MTAALVAGLIGRDRLLSALSPADYKVLRLLQKGCAYQVRGAWRFRGLRSRVKERALVSVLEKGLAERVETEQHHQVKITLAGCAANQQCRRVEVEPLHGISGRWNGSEHVEAARWRSRASN
jgi:hypothetical protein